MPVDITGFLTTPAFQVSLRWIIVPMPLLQEGRERTDLLAWCASYAQCSWCSSPLAAARMSSPASQELCE